MKDGYISDYISGQQIPRSKKKIFRLSLSVKSQIEKMVGHSLKIICDFLAPELGSGLTEMRNYS